jgi:competence protein ComEC
MKAVFQNNPFLRLVLPFILGIYLGFHFSIIDKQYLFYFLLSAMPMALIFQFVNKHSFNRLKNYLLIFTFFILGYYQTSSKIYSPSEFKKKEIISAQLLTYPDSAANSLKVKVQLQKIITDSINTPLIGKAILYLAKDANGSELVPGSMITFKGRPQLITNRGNPFEFDYKSWAANNHIYYSLYVKDGDWFIDSKAGEFSLQFELKKIRRKLLDYYKRSGISDEELSVFSALTLGDKTLLDGELKEGYAAAGLMHVLAVSGLHVGIIYLVVRLLCGGLLRLKYGKVIRFILSILVLWGYATLTGLSPSVTRAATMFSVFVLGDLLGRKYAIYNSIGLAAFILLFYDPYLLFNVGFQMSFLAVIGIVVFYPVIYKWIYVPNKWFDKVWQMIAVSLAAQLITTPLGLYYFNQFPVLFLLSNLLMIPLATLLMYLFVVMMVVFPLPVLSSKIGWCISRLTEVMNGFTDWVKGYEWAIYKSGSYDLFQVLLLYFLIASIAYWGFRTTYRNLKVILCVLIVLISYDMMEKYSLQSENRFIAFNTYNQPLWLMSAGNNYCAGNLDSSKNAERFLKPVKLNFDLENEIMKDYPEKQEIAFFGRGEYNGVYYNYDYFPILDSMNCRWLLLSKNAPDDIFKLINVFNPLYVIADASVPFNKLKSWQKKLETQGGNLINLKEKGAFFETWSSN